MVNPKIKTSDLGMIIAPHGDGMIQGSQDPKIKTSDLGMIVAPHGDGMIQGSTKVGAPPRSEAATPASKSKSGKVILATDAKLSSEHLRIHHITLWRK